MIQRKQTIFMLLAICFSILCLAFPIARWVPMNMGVENIVYNLGIRDGNGHFVFTTLPLFIIQVLTVPIGVFAIFLYHKRMVQARLCTVNMFLLIAWYVLYAVFGQPDSQAYTFRLSAAAALPLLSIIFYFLARRSIIADEKLVRSSEHFR